MKGTEGLLHVKNVYVEDYQFRNLRMVFKDGKVTEYSCGNFEDAGLPGTLELIRALGQLELIRLPGLPEMIRTPGTPADRARPL